MSGGKIVYVLGELNPDIIMTGRDIVPEFNREKLLDSFEIVLGSSSAITAAGLAGLGAEVRFVSVVGDDSLGEFCMGELRKAGVNTANVSKDKRWSTGVTLSFSTASDRALMTHLGAIPHLRPENIPEEMYDEAAHVHFGSFYLIEDMRPHWREVFSRLAANGVTTSFDTGWDLHGAWHRDTIGELLGVTGFFIPSEEEIMRIYNAETLEEALGRLPAERGRVIVKRGSRGALLLEPDGTSLEAEPYPVEPIDTTGAGDSFNAGLIWGVVNRQDMSVSLQWANACGALATQRIGGAGEVPAMAEMSAFMRSRKRIQE